MISLSVQDIEAAICVLLVRQDEGTDVDVGQVIVGSTVIVRYRRS